MNSIEGITTIRAKIHAKVFNNLFMQTMDNTREKLLLSVANATKSFFV